MNDTHTFDNKVIDVNISSPEPLLQSPKSKKDPFWKIITTFILIVALLRVFVIDPFLVHGNSMQPTYDNSDYVIVDKFSYNITKPKRGEVVVFNAPTNDGRYFIKRIIGLPGERVLIEGKKTKIFNNDYPEGFILGEPYVIFGSDRLADRTLRDDEYFVMGDNRNVSSDSRIWGALKKEAITGRAFLRLLPLSKIGMYPGFIDEFDQTVYPEKTNSQK